MSFDQKVALCIKALEQHPGYIQNQSDDAILAAINIYLQRLQSS